MFSIKELYNKRLIRFFLVGGLNTAFGYGLFAFLIYIGLHYSVAGIVGTIIGVLFNFKTVGLIVFRSKNNKLIIRFFAVYVIIYTIGVSSLAIFKYFGINEYIGGAIMLLPSGLLGYFLNKKLVFIEPKKDEYK